MPPLRSSTWTPRERARPESTGEGNEVVELRRLLGEEGSGTGEDEEQIKSEGCEEGKEACSLSEARKMHLISTARLNKIVEQKGSWASTGRGSTPRCTAPVSKPRARAKRDT